MQTEEDEFNIKTDIFNWKKVKTAIRPHVTLVNCFAALLAFVIVVSGACFAFVLFRWIRPSGVYPDTIENWYEVNSQILNACFTVIAIITHPYRIQLAFWTYKWIKASNDAPEKQEYAAKINASMPDIVLFPCNLNCTSPSSLETVHPPTPPAAAHRLDSEAEVEVVVVCDSVNTPTSSSRPLKKLMSYSTPPRTWYAILLLLNLNCIFQYPITIAMWLYIGQASTRPPWIIALFLPLSFLCGVVSGAWPAVLSSQRKKKMKDAETADSHDDLAPL